MAQPLKIRADYDRIKEVLINLVTNANEATDHGNIIIRSYRQVIPSEADLLGRKAQSFYIIVEIEDSGCGIKEENINRVFDPFFTTRPTGTGLGLSITKRIVEEHGGRIEVESNRGSGAKFKIYIPLQED